MRLETVTYILPLEAVGAADESHLWTDGEVRLAQMEMAEKTYHTLWLEIMAIYVDRVEGIDHVGQIQTSAHTYKIEWEENRALSFALGIVLGGRFLGKSHVGREDQRNDEKKYNTFHKLLV